MTWQHSNRQGAVSIYREAEHFASHANSMPLFAAALAIPADTYTAPVASTQTSPLATSK